MFRLWGLTSDPSAAPPSQVRVPQLQVDGGRERRLARSAPCLHPPGLSGVGRHLDEAGGQFRQAEAHQQRTGRPGTRKGHFPLRRLELWSQQTEENVKVTQQVSSLGTTEDDHGKTELISRCFIVSEALSCYSFASFLSFVPRDG